MAQSGHANGAEQCPLSGAKRTWLKDAAMSASNHGRASLPGQRPTIYLSLYFLTQLLKLYAIRLKQQRFAILSYARNPCPEAVWINLEPHFSDFEAVIRFWHGYPPIASSHFGRA
jgi:hypothetical protein